jgi:membrane protein YqaA with SNARE-associated domain
MTLLPAVLTVLFAPPVPTFGGVPLQFAGLEGAVENATGVIGLLVIAAYSFLIAVVLPLPSEIVLVPAGTGLGLGLPPGLGFALVVLVSGLAKATGSVVAFHVGHEAQRRSGPVIDRLRDSRFDVVERLENRTVQIAREYGYIGLAFALMIPFFPDTLSIYAFTVLEENYVKFAAATFAGSVGRLLFVAGVLAPFFSFFGI